MRTEIEARRALWVLAGVLLIAQPLSLLLGTSYLQRWGSPGNAYNQWTTYNAHPTPDVLFIGDSRVRLDIDTNELSRSLSASVASIGIDAAKPEFLEALTERIAAAPATPRTVVIALSEYQLNASWDAKADSGGLQTNYFWQISGPPDARYIATALRLDPERGRLLAGWTVPLLANYSVIVEGFRCDIAALRRRNDCADEYTDRDRVMDEAVRRRWEPIVRDGYLGSYEVSVAQAASAIRAARALLDRGIAVRFVILPVYRAEALAPAAYARFRERAASIASAVGARFIDLHSTYDDRPEIFFDSNHLTRRGARELAGVLASSLAVGR